MRLLHNHYTYLLDVYMYKIVFSAGFAPKTPISPRTLLCIHLAIWLYIYVCSRCIDIGFKYVLDVYMYTHRIQEMHRHRIQVCVRCDVCVTCDRHRIQVCVRCVHIVRSLDVISRCRCETGLFYTCRCGLFNTCRCFTCRCETGLYIGETGLVKQDCT